MIEEWTLESLAGLVGRMREAQVEFNRLQRQAKRDERQRLLQVAFEMENDVDRALAEIDERRSLFDRGDAS